MKSDKLRWALLMSCLLGCSTEKSKIELGVTRQADTAADGGSALPVPGEYPVFHLLHPSPSPEARMQLGFAFDPGRGEAVLFGGNIPSSSSPPPADTWAYDGAWSKACEDTFCANPGNRSSSGFAFASGRGVAVLFGGFDGGQARCDTWEWDGAAASWTEKSSPACAETGLTAARFGHSMAEYGNNVALFGGKVGNSTRPLTNDLFAWNGTSWNNLCASLCQAEPMPAPRYAATLVYAGTGVQQGTLFLFGGFVGNAYTNDLWSFDLGGAVWHERCTSPACKSSAPAGRWRHGAAFDSIRGRMFVHGGCSDSACLPPLKDAFEYDPAADVWVKIADPALPEAKSDFGVAFDAKRGRIVEFGGFTGQYLNDTVEYYTRGGACSTAATCNTHVCQKKSASDATGICAEPCPGGDAGGSTEHCANGFLCNTACDAPCQTCAAVPGVCTPIAGGVDDEAGDAPGSRCAGDHTCNTAGACALAVGQGCHDDTECATGNCAKYGSHVCALVGCGDVPCLRAAPNGSCTPADFPPECGGSGCTTDGQCIQECTDDHQCSAEFFCDTEGTHHCKSGIRLGDACKDSQECGKGTCYDGVCCEKPCGDSCEVCGAGGKCVPIAAGEAPRPDHPACPGTGVCAGLCNGNDHGCRYPTSVTPCGPGTCFAQYWRIAQICDEGSCVQAPEAQSCGAFSCDEGTCHTECSTSAECTGTAECDLTGGVGVCRDRGVICVNDSSSVKTTSGSIVSCNGYPCVGSACMFRPCGADTDCTAGYECTPDHRCVEKPGPIGKQPQADGGIPAQGEAAGNGVVPSGASCSVGRVAQERSRTAPLFALTALMALALRRIAEKRAPRREPPRETS